MRYAIARYKAEQREMAYRIFVTDCLRITTENTAALKKDGAYIGKRYYDIINPPPADDLFVTVGFKDEASDGVSNLSSKLQNGLKTAAKVGAAAVGAAATGVAALTKGAIENYAEYEQLVGGVETLFKGSADTVQQYAANAYKTAGLSANEYMETVTSFSASLLQSLGGDTNAAAEYADMAITDMSDNANKMGTSMEMIQNAYQGFAKQNYTINLMSAA